MITHYPNCCIEKLCSDSADVLCSVSQSIDSSDTCLEWHCIKVLVMSQREDQCLNVCQLQSSPTYCARHSRLLCIKTLYIMSLKYCGHVHSFLYCLSKQPL